MRDSYYICVLAIVMAAACGGSREGLVVDDPDADVNAPDGGGSGDDDGGGGGDADAAVPPGPPLLRQCTGKPFTAQPPGTWAQTGSAGIASGAVQHNAQDQIEPPGATMTLHGRFAYGALSSALPGEPVRVYLDECGADWKLLGEATTDDAGLAAFEVTDELPVGVYEARFEVVGDASVVASSLWVLPEGTHLVVTDIDGTMTTSDFELVQQILNPSYVPKAYPDAEALTHAHQELGHVVVYLTGRFGSLMEETRVWLAMLGFEPGPLHVTDTDAQFTPTDAAVGTFKRDYLTSLLDKGYVIDFAYGNATTDIFAYLGAGLPATDVWIIGSNAGQQGTNSATDSWTQRVGEVEMLTAVEQPFVWP